MTLRIDAWTTRVGASERLDGAAQVVYVLASNGRESHRIEMDVAQARQLSRRLKRWADAVQPPVRRKSR